MGPAVFSLFSGYTAHATRDQHLGSILKVKLMTDDDTLPKFNNLKRDCVPARLSQWQKLLNQTNLTIFSIMRKLCDTHQAISWCKYSVEDNNEGWWTMMSFMIISSDEFIVKAKYEFVLGQANCYGIVAESLQELLNVLRKDYQEQEHEYLLVGLH